MKNNFRIYMGIDVGGGPKPITFVVFDPSQQVQAIGEGDIVDALAYAAGQTGGALLAVNAAARPNQGRMRRSKVRAFLSPPPPKGKYYALRQAEYELEQAGMAVPHTPDAPEKCLPWVQRGFTLVEKLACLGYEAFSLNEPSETPLRRQMEVNADAIFWSLLGVTPLQAGTLEGRIQRQLALEDQRLKVPDAMAFFEEVTRYKILKSRLPVENILSQPEINAWAAAHTAWLAANNPDRIMRFGEPEEGFIYLPCPK